MGKLQIESGRAPIFTGAGLAKDEAGVSRLAESQAAAVMIGAFTEPSWAGNDQGGTKQVEYWDAAQEAYFNSIGLKNPGRVGASEYLPRTIARLGDAGILAFINISTLAHEDPLKTLPGLAEWALEMGADGVEINGSCPNLSLHHALLCQDVESSIEVLDAVRQKVGEDAYLIYKVSALPESTVEKYKTLGELEVDAIDTINTIGNQPSPINPVTGRPFIEVNNGLAGMSGPIIKDKARTNLKYWLGASRASKRPSFDVFSIGGVKDGREVNYRRVMGALLVGGTQFFRRSANPLAAINGWAEQYWSAMKEE